MERCGKSGGVILARWVSHFDCGYETNWWYVIKDTPFDISALKAKRRYEVNKGIKNFSVRRINAIEYGDELYDIQTAAFATYPEKYRPKVEKQSFIDGLNGWNSFDVFGAFSKDDGNIVGYALLMKKSKQYINFAVLKVNPKYEKLGVNAAMINAILEYYKDFLEKGGVICDGARSVYHETNFQNYLEKYFDFRKAYCKLHIKYKPALKIPIKVLYCFRKLLSKYDDIKLIHSINGVFKMEEIVRSQHE